MRVNCTKCGEMFTPVGIPGPFCESCSLPTRREAPMRKLISVVWRPFELGVVHDHYGGTPGYRIDGEFHAFYDDGTSLVWRYDPDIKAERWMDVGWPGPIPNLPITGDNDAR